MVIIMAQATRTTNKLTKDHVPKWVPPPTIWVPSFDFLSFCPTLLLHTVRKASWVVFRIRCDSEFFELGDELGGGKVGERG